jgi:hypothetical protein
MTCRQGEFDKVAYRSPAKARQAQRKLSASPRLKDKILRIYECPQCGGWAHLHKARNSEASLAGVWLPRVMAVLVPPGSVLNFRAGPKWPPGS